MVREVVNFALYKLSSELSFHCSTLFLKLKIDLPTYVTFRCINTAPITHFEASDFLFMNVSFLLA